MSQLQFDYETNGLPAENRISLLVRRASLEKSDKKEASTFSRTSCQSGSQTTSGLQSFTPPPQERHFTVPAGKARKITTFADGLNIPMGITPLPTGAIAFSIPNIYRFTDTKGTGKADEREVLYGSVGYRDTHGMVNSFTWGFDGQALFVVKVRRSP